MMAAFTCKDPYIVAYDSYIFPWDLAKKKDLLVGFSFQKNNSILKHKSRRATRRLLNYLTTEAKSAF